MVSVAIIGGGLSGLTAAFYLTRTAGEGRSQGALPARVRLFEASDRWGGVIRTERIDGYLLEHGADMFASQPDAALRLCDALGLSSRLIAPQPGVGGAAIVHRGRPIRVPEGFVLMRPTRLMSMVTTPLLSPAGKLRLFAEGLIPPRRETADESIADFVKRRLGKEVLERIVQPLVGGIYTGDVNRLSMAAAMPEFARMEREDGSLWAATRRRRREGGDRAEQTSAGARYSRFRSFPGGLQELIDALAAALPQQTLCLQSRVTSLEPADGGWRVSWVSRGGGQEAESFDHVIFAAPPGTSAELLAEIAPQAAELLKGIEHASSAIVALGVRENQIARPIDVAGFVVPDCEKRRVLAASFTGDKFAGRTPPGHKLIRVFLGGALQPQLVDLTDEELVDIATTELADLIGMSGKPEWTKVIRWLKAMPQYHVGHNERIERIETLLRERPGLHAIGNAFRGVGIAPTAAAAEAAAARIHAGTPTADGTAAADGSVPTGG